jgi:hypothetical protein
LSPAKGAVPTARSPHAASCRSTAAADGTQRVTTWKYADDVNLLLADGTPMKIPGMYLTLLRQTKTGP